MHASYKLNPSRVVLRSFALAYYFGFAKSWQFSFFATSAGGHCA
jgi:hypothetical protein